MVPCGTHLGEESNTSPTEGVAGKLLESTQVTGTHSFDVDVCGEQLVTENTDSINPVTVPQEALNDIFCQVRNKSIITLSYNAL